jgi:1-deoxy-D-xylulose-5-phosphate reductoisomerase
MQAGGNAAVTLNAANEVAVDAFLKERITFDRIPSLLNDVMQDLEVSKISSLDDVLRYDQLARNRALERVKQKS